jgi:MFS family permease
MGRRPRLPRSRGVTAGTPVSGAPPAGVRLGLAANLAQFSLLVAVNALVGGMVGQERTVLPLLAEREFGVRAATTTLTFILAFGAVKAVTNLAAGTLSERWGRKRVLVAGWLAGAPVPLLLMWAPSWGWVVAANVLLGVNQGLTWSMTVIMKIDLAGPDRRGLAMGLNEAAGYGAVAATAAATGWIAARWGLRPEPFFLGAAFAAVGLGLSAIVVRDTGAHARAEADSAGDRSRLGIGQMFALTTVRDPALSAVSQAGLVNNLNDALAWGLFPILFAGAGVSAAGIGALVALYPAVWGVGQLVTGPLSDRCGRKPLIGVGMLVQAGAIGLVAATTGFGSWALATVMLGAGTAMVYPALLAAIGDVAHPSWRASAVGVYRLWRDSGFVAGALLAGVVADALGLRAAVWTVAALTAASAVVVALRMYETHPHHAGVSRAGRPHPRSSSLLTRSGRSPAR